MVERIRMYDFSGRKRTLAGTPLGQEHFLKLVPRLQRWSEPGVLFLDFAKVEVATSSYLRQFFIAVRNHCRAVQNNVYPVLANPSEMTLEELDVVLGSLNDAILTCNLDDTGKVTNVQARGTLDEKQKLTFEAVASFKEADAATLASHFQAEEKIGVTGWNNRLAGLAAKGLLIEKRRGRGKLYRPVVEAVWA